MVHPGVAASADEPDAGEGAGWVALGVSGDDAVICGLAGSSVEAGVL